jgi:hypothetical protein
MLSDNQKKSLRNHCDTALSNTWRENNQTVEQFINSVALTACRKSQLARGKFAVDTNEAIEYCIAYIKKAYDTKMF